MVAERREHGNGEATRGGLTLANGSDPVGDDNQAACQKILPGFALAGVRAQQCYVLSTEQRRYAAKVPPQLGHVAPWQPDHP